MKYTRKCPNCNNNIFYKEKKSLNLANRKDSDCFGCVSKRINENQRKFDLSFLLAENNESFYWVGLLFADGYITNREISLCLHKKDRILIDKFRILCKNPNINIKGDSLRIAIRDKTQVKKFVDKFNIICPKTYNPIVFNNIKKYSNSLLYSLLIGLIDGDGNISSSIKYKTYAICLTFHENWLNFYKKLLKRLNIPFNYMIRNNICSLRIARKKEIIKVYNNMLDLNITYLERKWNKIINF